MATSFEFCAYIYMPIYKLVLAHRRNPKISFYLDDGLIGNKKQKNFDKFRASKRVA